LKVLFHGNGFSGTGRTAVLRYLVAKIAGMAGRTDCVVNQVADVTHLNSERKLTHNIRIDIEIQL